MNDPLRKVRGFLLTTAAGLALSLVPVAPTLAQAMAAQASRPAQIAGVDNTRMGPYRALAQLSYEAFQKGDAARAAELSRILERTWDAAEEGGGERSLVKRNKELFEQLDKAMDAYIKPILHFATKSPDAAAVTAAYNDFLDKLKQGE